MKIGRLRYVLYAVCALGLWVWGQGAFIDYQQQRAYKFPKDLYQSLPPMEGKISFAEMLKFAGQEFDRHAEKGGLHIVKDRLAANNPTHDLLAFDQNRDGLITKGEFDRTLLQVFAWFDFDGDGAISAAEEIYRKRYGRFYQEQRQEGVYFKPFLYKASFSDQPEKWNGIVIQLKGDGAYLGDLLYDIAAGRILTYP